MTATAPRPDWDRTGLPGWAYHSAALLELEKAEIFATHWQIACHVSDLDGPGAFVSFDIGDERVLVLRGADGVVRAMHNLCRHRGARVVAEPAGRCRNALVCPFHGWVYNLDGSLRGPARPTTFGALDRASLGLKPVEHEIWQGFVFVRCRPGPQGSVAETMAPFARDIADYRTEEVVPTVGIQSMEIPVNWKAIRDVDNEGYHVAMAHPALHDLYGAGYRDMTAPGGMSWSIGPYNAKAGRRWSVSRYLAIAPEAAWLPAEKQRRWAYYGMFPNGVLSMTPETVSFYQEIPVSVERTAIRGAVYRRRGEDRRQRLARYLAARIDRATQTEDVQLSIWSNEAMKSSAFDGFHLSDLEYGVRNHHDELRRLLPVLTVAERPPEDRLKDVNEALRAARRDQQEEAPPVRDGSAAGATPGG